MNPVLLTVEDAALSLALGRTKVYELVESGALRSVKIGPRDASPCRRWTSSSTPSTPPSRARGCPPNRLGPSTPATSRPNVVKAEEL